MYVVTKVSARTLFKVITLNLRTTTLKMYIALKNTLVYNVFINVNTFAVLTEKYHHRFLEKKSEVGILILLYYRNKVKKNEFMLFSNLRVLGANVR